MHIYLAAPVAAALVLIAGTAAGQAVPVPSPSAPLIAANDNRRAAGERFGKALRLKLVVDTGRWQPEGPDGRTLVGASISRRGPGVDQPGTVSARACWD